MFIICSRLARPLPVSLDVEKITRAYVGLWTCGQCKTSGLLPSPKWGNIVFSLGSLEVLEVVAPRDIESRKGEELLQKERNE
ncbi:hypothetical protein FRX31_014970 [Thalictrum thalictroides]|uniref:Uncharacterized protein n=1 Tax=Thalictrum thalictroides TaxID=46969 RepID=A0A7J6WES8_THATH|nr:hypothetical protein FRX31_014970 [Thalictrum thalictroides]